MSDKTTTAADTTAADEKNKSKTPAIIVEPAIDSETNQQLVLRTSDGQHEFPIVMNIRPAHEGKVGGVKKQIEEKVTFIPTISSVTAGFALIQDRVLAADGEENQLKVLHRIVNDWLKSSAERALVPIANDPENFEFSLEAFERELAAAQASRKSGPNIDELRDDLAKLNEQTLVVFEILEAFTQNDGVWTEELTNRTTNEIGRTFNEPEPLIEFRSEARSKAGTLKALILEKEARMKKARDAAKAKKEAREAAAAAAKASGPKAG